MVKKPDKAVVEKVKTLYRSNDLARRFFDGLAERTNDATATTVENMMRQLGLSRYEAVALARQVADTDAAEFWLGRRGSKSRLVWKFSCISVGQAASGEVGELEEVTDPLPESEESRAAVAKSNERQIGLTNLSIAEAKRLLADSLGLEPGNIEITVKA